MSNSKSHVQHKSDAAHYGIPVSFRYQPLRSMPDSQCRQQVSKEISRSDQGPRTGLSALAEIAGRPRRKTQQSCESLEAKCEYLTVEIPNRPTHRIRVYGCSLAVGARYSMRAELSLSILREVATLLQNSIRKDEQDRLDWILSQASALVGSFVSDPKTRRKQHTCRALIKVLQRVEALSRHPENEYSRRNKGVE
ncbi:MULTISPECIES: hypothetical protein [Pantoea]|jgi:hypothetical protein|uniref:hypothetical protein n=1 Tax=Pantoea TaxID=53335 RepID=UPI0011B7D881|nr:MULTISPECIES: hypothetical protein [Pantoea]KAA5924014.1 hypothetical protein F3I59_18770 [Pantoea sp. VH_8]KAA5930517.1 hypothetical protein F3I58_18855 [Pantoea sp. VH_4]KAA5996855.1 hypothetical protein F3I50_12670 [Pantoea sp. M_5]MDH1168658.1 hypothetical protein [Pantoea agglomerans]